MQKHPLFAHETENVSKKALSRAFIAYPDDCMTCFICERACPAGAIDVHPFREKLPPVFPGPAFAAVEGNDLRERGGMEHA